MPKGVYQRKWRAPSFTDREPRLQELTIEIQREDFREAVTAPRSRLREAPPVPAGISARACREGLRVAYGGDVHEVVLASDAEIRACSRLNTGARAAAQ